MNLFNSCVNHFLDEMNFAYRTKDQTEHIKINKPSSGVGFVTRIVPRPDLLIIISNCILAEQTNVRFAMEESKVELMICYQGDGEVQAGGVFSKMRPNTVTLGLKNGGKGEYFFAGGQPLITLGIHFSASAFDHYLTGLDGSQSTDFNQLIGNRPLLQFQQAILDTPIKHIADRIMHLPFTCATRNIALESLALEILSVSFQQLITGSKQATSASITRSDLQKLHHAEEILLHRMDDPPSLLELSRIIGMNDFKLKHHFKTVFGNTVFGYLRDKRMEKAMTMLQGGKTSVSAVATMVGYTNMSYFASAFRKRYGMNPSEFLHYAK